MSPPPASAHVDVLVAGAGAAGLSTAIFARRANPQLRVVVVDGARAPGAKILVSGGSRCNVTNTVVTDADFNGGASHLVRRVLRALPVPSTVEFFRSLGVALQEEPGGKLFPRTNRSRDVLDALLAGLRDSGAELKPAHRVLSIARWDGAFEVATSQGLIHARAVVLATGGLALPKSGSDGAGYGFAQHFGHSLIPTTPALAPLVFDVAPDHDWMRALSGVALPVRLSTRVDGRIASAITGAMLWTHFGISGPVALDSSRHWLRARLEGRTVTLAANLVPGQPFETLDRRWVERARSAPKATIGNALADLVPASIGAAVVAHLGVPPSQRVAALTRDDRRRLSHQLHDCPLPIAGSRGYTYAEVTAGGVPLTEINTATMESRHTPGLFLVGEILDVDGRIGGFNFQWAWSSAKVAGDALAARGAQPAPP